MIKHVCSILPENIAEVILSWNGDLEDSICEIRLRKNAPISISTYRKNLYFDVYGGVSNDISRAVITTQHDIDYVINKLCEGSVYKYMTTLNSGYIVTKLGIRAGVCGECVYDGGKISALSKFESLNIRIPKDIDSLGDVLSLYISRNPNSSVLLISPPGYGKTTVIRSVAKGLATGKFGKAKRVAVIDERGEILPGGGVGLIDRFSGYSKSDGIEIATRLFSPELIICDEIGQNDDTKALLSVQNSGVPFLATTHGKNVESAFFRPNIKMLVEQGAFDSFAVIEKGDNGSSIHIEKGKL